MGIKFNLRIQVLLKKRIASFLSVFLIAGLIAPIQFMAPASASTAATSCGTFVGGSNPTFDSKIKVVPLHGKAMYVNFRNGVDAAYMGYRIENTTNAAISGLWIEVTNFLGTVRLANPADSIQSIGSIPAKSGNTNGSKVVYFLIKADSYSTSGSKHDVRIHSTVPNGTGTIYAAGAGQCFYEFSKVVRTLSASANKVNTISVSGSSVLGANLAITVTGSTGQGGSGSASPDGSTMWLSPASQSSWPTRAIRLVSTTITFKNPNLILRDQLMTDGVVNSPSGSGVKFTSRTTYVATYTFRIIGSTLTNPAIRPTNHISSGTQIKFTGKYPSTQVTLNTSDVSVPVTSSKTVDTPISNTVTTNPNQSSPAVPAGTYYQVNYRVTFNASQSVNMDFIVDDPSPGVYYKQNSVRVIEGGITRTPAEPKIDITNAQGYDTKLTFGGPFVGTSIVLTYTMYVPNNGVTYTNYAYGQIGSKLIGSNSNSVTGQAVTTGATPGSSSVTAPIPMQPQTIDFPQPPAAGAGSSYQLSAVATSGLSVGYQSLTPTVCTVADGIVTYLTVGNCDIQASQGGDSQWSAANSVTRTIVVTTGQVITFNPSLTMTHPSSQTINITASSGLPVDIESLTTDICTVSPGANPAFTITTVTSGECVILATQDGDANVGPAPEVERRIIIGQTQTIQFVAPDNQQTSTGSLTATATSLNSSNTGTGLPVQLVSDSPNICTVGEDNQGVSPATVNWTRSGLCVLRASQDGYNANDTLSAFAPATDVVRSFTIGSVPTVTVTTDQNSVEGGASVVATVTVAPPAGDANVPTGSITLYVNGYVISANAIQSSTLSNGSRNFTVTARTLSFNSTSDQMVFTATYAGDSNFGSSQTRDDVTVAVTPPTKLPIVTTAAAINVTTTTVTIGGTINPNGFAGVAFSNQLDATQGNLSNSTTNGATPATGSNSSDIAMTEAITGLSTATLYFHRARALETGSNTQVLGSTLKFVTKPEKAATPTLTQSSNLIIVSFAPISVQGAGVVVEYVVSCTNTTDNLVLAPVTITGDRSATQQANISGGITGKSYTCTVTAQSSASGAVGGGAGAASDVSNTLALVDNPYAITDSPTNIQKNSFSANGKVNPRGNANAQRAFIEYGTTSNLAGATKVDSDSITTSGTSDVGLQSLSVTGLAAATIYYYRAGIASASVGGTHSIVATAPTIVSILTLPDAPTNVTIEYIAGTTGANVKFTPPLTGDNVTLSYTVTCTSTGNPTLTASGAGTLSGGLVSISVAGFAENSDYECSVTATSSANVMHGGGTGGPGNSAVTRSLLRDLLATTDLPTNIRSDSFEMQGKADTRGNAQGRGKFEYGTSSTLASASSSVEETITGDGEAVLTTTSLSGLIPATIYYYRAVASANATRGNGSIRSVLTLAPTPTLDSITISGNSLVVNFSFTSAGPNVTLQFTVVCTPTGGGAAVTQTGTSSPITVTGITQEIEYSCEIYGTSSSNQAIHGGGRGANSNAISRTIPATAPQGGGGGGGGGVTPVVPVVPTEPTPLVEYTREPITPGTKPKDAEVKTSGNTPGRTPIPNLPPNAPVRLIQTVKDSIQNKLTVEPQNGQLVVTPQNGWTGKMSVPVITVVDGKEQEIFVDVEVTPVVTPRGGHTLNSIKESVIQWDASPSQVVKYIVELNGRVVCEVQATSCSVSTPVGPNSQVKVTAIGNDDTRSNAAVKPYEPEKRVQALTVYFDENKFNITSQARRDLNRIARVLKREGFTDLKLFGHTDGQSGSRNAINLSTQRATIVQNYLLAKLGVDAQRVTVAKTASGEKKPAASNRTAAGQAKNRRTELWLR